MSDIADTIAPKSDQLDAVDLLGGPQTFTVERVTVKAGAEQPTNIYLREFPRPWRPGVNQRRVLVAGWGKTSADYTGRRVTLYCEPDVSFGNKKVGGTRISHMSHLDGVLSVPIIESKGKTAIYTVQPLVEQSRPQQQQQQDPPLVLALRAAGIRQDHWRSTCAVIVGRELASANDLSAEEVAKVIDALKADAQPDDGALPMDAES